MKEFAFMPGEAIVFYIHPGAFGIGTRGFWHAVDAEQAALGVDMEWFWFAVENGFDPLVQPVWGDDDHTFLVVKPLNWQFYSWSPGVRHFGGGLAI
jgi:hypothetical protein